MSTHDEPQQGLAAAVSVATLALASGLHAAFYLRDLRNLRVVVLAVTCMGVAVWGFVGTAKARADRALLSTATFALAGGLCLAVALRPALGLVFGD